MIIMTDTQMQNVDDLEDGEIESDSEQAVQEPQPAQTPDKLAVAAEPTVASKDAPKDKEPLKDFASKKSDKRDKKKSKDHHSKREKDYKSHKEKNKTFFPPAPVEDDFAGNIEKAIRMALKRGKEGQGDIKIDNDKFDSGIDDLEAKKKHKKRKKHNQSEKESSKKKRKIEEPPASDAEVDEDEMMCVRGASPVFKNPVTEQHVERYSSDEEMGSESSNDSRGQEHDKRGRSGRGRGRGDGRQDRRPDRSRGRPHRQEPHPMQDPDGVCLFYMQGKCYKGDDCIFSHNAQPPRKMELCKFYLMDCCAKRDKCLYLHSDFPCKFYHTGIQCIYKDDCKFAHGKPLTENLKMILLKHIESAPKEILGDFPRLSREAALAMLNNTQNKLVQQYSPNKSNTSSSKEKAIPSIFDLNIPKPLGFDEKQQSNMTENSNHNADKKNRGNKVRQSRWCDSTTTNMLNPPLLNTHTAATEHILNIQNLNGVLTPQQISDLLQLGIENLNQLSQLTVNQLNQLGLTMNQINDIQLNTMSIQKLGLINSQSSTSLFTKQHKDLDMRVSPVITDLSLMAPKVDVVGKDVDMRFQPTTVQPSLISEKDSTSKIESSFCNDPRKQKATLDIDQYTKDAMKFTKSEKETPIIDQQEQNEDSESTHSEPNKPCADIDHRVLKYISDATVANVKLATDNAEEEEDKYDNKISNKAFSGLKPHEMLLSNQKRNEERARRMTTDDEEDNLQIDEKWYSSDEEHNDNKIIGAKLKSPPLEKPKFYAPTIESTSMEPTTVITKLGDLSKIDISAEVTKLLSTIKNNTPPEEKEKPKKEESKLRDPRNMLKKSPEHKSPIEIPKKVSKPAIVSIYNCIEGGGDTDNRKRTDIDLRPIQDLDLRLPTFGDTDLRQTSGTSDVDLRLGLPFKPLSNYTPASEIDGSINSHPPILYKLHIVDVPRPDYTDIKNGTPKSQAALDPRLRKVFRLSLDENPLEVSEKSTKSSHPSRIDPRKKTQESSSVTNKPTAPKPPLDLQAVIQTSNWYKELSSNQKILVNQQLASVTLSLKKFHQDNTQGKMFDLNEIHSNSVLTKIFTNLGVIINEKGELSQVSLPDITMPSNMVNMNFNQNDNFNNMGNMMDNMGVMGLNHMGQMQGGPMGPIGSFDMRFQGGDPRGAPGLLGIAPGVPHNFDGNYNNMPNFNNDNNFNGNFDNINNFNGPSNNMNDYRGDKDKFYRNQQGGQKGEFKSYRGSNRGGGERWRGSRGRDRRGGGGNWKNDRR